MQLEFHQLDRRCEHLRVRQPRRQRQLMASSAESGQQAPIMVVRSSDHPERYLVIDGYKRVASLEQLGRDTVDATVWAMSEAEAPLLDRTLRFSMNRPRRPVPRIRNPPRVSNGISDLRGWFLQRARRKARWNKAGCCRSEEKTRFGI
jgi:uncharacterized ParB-like nuclease family protein